MKCIHYLLPVLLLACGNAATDEKTPLAAPAGKTEAAPAAGNEADPQKSARIKIIKDGAVVQEYSPDKPGAARMAEESGKESLMINLNSPDNAFSLLGSLKNAASGTYAFGEAGKAAAQIEIYSNGKVLPPRLILDKGQLTITLNGKTCSGHFSGTKTGIGGRKYEVSGTFTNIPLVKPGSGETY